MIKRCAWSEELPIYRGYHDNEWGKPQFDEQKLFEKLCLEGQQAGLVLDYDFEKTRKLPKCFFSI